MASLLNLVTTAGDRLVTNTRASFRDMSLQKWIRVVMIVCTYLLLRPYLMKLGSKTQMAQYEKQKKYPAQEEKGALSPNKLRGQVDIPDDTDEEEEEGKGKATGAEWGKKARRRQRHFVKKMLDEEEKRLIETREEEEDKDIDEFLVKE